MIWLLPLYHQYKLNWQYTKRLTKRDNSQTGERGRNQILPYHSDKAWPSVNHSILSAAEVLIVWASPATAEYISPKPERAVGHRIGGTAHAPRMSPAAWASSPSSRVPRKATFDIASMTTVSLSCRLSFSNFFASPAAIGQVNNHVSVFIGVSGDFSKAGTAKKYRSAGVVLSR
jgi:hypothetical protein